MGIKSKKVAIYPGTFDPITLGHVDIIKRSSNLFDELIVAIANHPSKAQLFSINDRIRLVRSEIEDHHFNNVRVEKCHGLLVDFVKHEKANIIVRGLRAVSDFEYEFQMYFVNSCLDKNTETIFLPATKDVHFVSSSFVKEIAKLGGKTDDFVSYKVGRELSSKFDD